MCLKSIMLTVVPYHSVDSGMYIRRYHDILSVDSDDVPHCSNDSGIVFNSDTMPV